MTTRSKRHIGVLLVLGSLAGGCTDNATKLSFAIQRHASSTVIDSPTNTLSYVPKSNPQLPYFLVFFPEHRVGRQQLEAAGLPTHLAERIYTEMAYLSVGDAPFLVVIQEGGDLSFTTRWSRFATVPEVLVIPGRGPTSLHLVPGAQGAVVEAEQ